MIRFLFKRPGRRVIQSAEYFQHILAPIWESNPLFWRVHLGTSLSQFIDAIQFKLQIVYKLLMQPLSPKSIASPKKILTKPIEAVLPQSLSPRLNSPNFNRYGFRQPGSDFNFALQSYLQGKSSPFYGKAPSLTYIKNKRPMLADTEQKIFSQVIGLIREIEELKDNIVAQLESIKQIQIQNPDVEEKMRYHGYSQPLNISQCNDLEEENAELFKQIEQIQSKKDSTLELALAAEKSQYEQLKEELAEAAPSLEQLKAMEDKINELKKMIHEIESQRSGKFKANYPGIDRLKAQNQDLRQRTIGFLKTHELETQEECDLSEYLKRDEHNRLQFMQELKKFKGEFKRLKEQNQSLRQRIMRRDRQYSKQNSGSKINTSKLESNKSSLQVESLVGKKRDRLSEYQSFIRMMQQNGRG